MMVFRLGCVGYQLSKKVLSGFIEMTIKNTAWYSTTIAVALMTWKPGKLHFHYCLTPFKSLLKHSEGMWYFASSAI